jgi:uncharacterized membrane protein YdbT with pleckstrin-like domain
MKGVWAAYALAVIVLGAAACAYFTWLQDKPRWLLLIPLIAVFPALKRHIRQRSVTLTMKGDHLTLSEGLLSKTRRTLDLAKVQDVTVQQTMRQRMVGVGDLILETAGERGGGLAIFGIDRPQRIADEILQAAHRAARARSQTSGSA